jgi:hypothetical protein
MFTHTKHFLATAYDFGTELFNPEPNALADNFLNQL